MSLRRSPSQKRQVVQCYDQNVMIITHGHLFVCLFVCLSSKFISKTKRNKASYQQQHKVFRQNYDPVIDFSLETKLYIVAPIGSGGNGGVWFAVTKDLKRCCSIKFIFPMDTRVSEEAKLTYINRSARNEYDNWNVVYGSNDDDVLPKCHLGKVKSGRCDDGHELYLCMPYISPAPKRMWPMLGSRCIGLAGDDVQNALRKFAASGYKQGSIRWEHFGFFPVPSKKKNKKDRKEVEGEDGGTVQMSPFVLPSIMVKGETSMEEDGWKKGNGQDKTKENDEDEEEEENEEEDDDESPELKLYCVDLGRIVAFEPDEDKEAWVQEAVETLRSNIPPDTYGFRPTSDFEAMQREGYLWEHTYRV